MSDGKGGWEESLSREIEKGNEKGREEGKKGKLFLIEKCQLRSIEEITELEKPVLYHHR